MTQGRTNNFLNGIMQGASIGSTAGHPIIGAAIGGVTGLLKRKNNSARQSLNDHINAQKEILKYQQDYNNWYTENQFQLLMQGAKKAGLHPFYGLANGHTPTSTGVNAPDYIGENNSEINRNRNIQDAITSGVQLKQDWNARQAAIRLTNQQTETEKINTLLKEQEVTGKQIENLRNKQNLTYEEKKYKADLEESYKRIAKTIEETTSTQLQNEYDANRNRVLREHPILSNIGFISQHLASTAGISKDAAEIIIKSKLGIKKRKK